MEQRVCSFKDCERESESVWGGTKCIFLFVQWEWEREVSFLGIYALDGEEYDCIFRLVIVFFSIGFIIPWQIILWFSLLQSVSKYVVRLKFWFLCFLLIFQVLGDLDDAVVIKVSSLDIWCFTMKIVVIPKISTSTLLCFQPWPPQFHHIFFHHSLLSYSVVGISFAVYSQKTLTNPTSWLLLPIPTQHLCPDGFLSLLRPWIIASSFSVESPRKRNFWHHLWRVRRLWSSWIGKLEMILIQRFLWMVIWRWSHLVLVHIWMHSRHNILDDFLFGLRRSRPLTICFISEWWWLMNVCSCVVSFILFVYYFTFFYRNFGDLPVGSACLADVQSKGRGLLVFWNLSLFSTPLAHLFDHLMELCKSC